MSDHRIVTSSDRGYALAFDDEYSRLSSQHFELNRDLVAELEFLRLADASLIGTM